MKTNLTFTALIFASLILVSCKKGVEKNEKKINDIAINQTATVWLAISGMTCEIGCAKTIQSKLSKTEGVIEAKVVFKDSIVTIKYEPNKVSTDDLTSFIDGIAGGNLYKATPVILLK